MGYEPGRASTRNTIPIEDAEIHSYAFKHEFTLLHIEGRLCSIRGCGNAVTQEDGAVCGRVVGKSGPRIMPRVVGWACASCTRLVLGDTGEGLP